MACQSSPIEEFTDLIEEYERAANSRDTAAFRRILALDDPRFREIEDHIPMPFGSEVADSILDWIDSHPDSGYRVKYRDVQVFPLSDTVAYAVAVNDWESPGGSGSGRATFVMVKDTGWRIIHGHWSSMPAQDE